jgi:hypothetical protein
MTAPLACDLGVFTLEQRERLRALVQQVFDACRDADELPDGYRLRFPSGGASLALSVTEWIALERLCCPCITFAIEFEEEQGRSRCA